MEWLEALPGGAAWTKEELLAAREIRLRPGQPVWALLPEGARWGQTPLTPEDVARAARALSAHSIAARQKELAAGFLPLPGGHRLGVCGAAGPEGIREITSLCLRLAHEVKGAGNNVFPLIRGKSALIVGPPGSGKTTLLRDLIRLYGEAGCQVGVADERGEIAACRDGAPQLDVGPCADVVTGMSRSRAVTLLIRAMAPQVIATDELGGPEDARAVLEAVRCGAWVLATAHGRSKADMLRRPGLDALLRGGAFGRLVILEAVGRPPRVTAADGGEE